MADFYRALQKVLTYEGGYSNHPDDRGGATRWGISEREFPDLDLSQLTYTQMQQLYREKYWDPLRLDEISVEAIADEVFEQAVNFGIGRAAANVQRALNYFREQGIAVDGVIGSLTLAAINSCKYPGYLLTVLNGIQIARYFEIVDSDPSQKVFTRGWLKRVELARATG